MDLISGTVTNSKGEFKLTGLNTGRYSLAVSFVGYLTNTTIVEIISASVRLTGPIYLTIPPGH